MRTQTNVTYICDVCGKAFDNEKEALACEKKHADIRAASEKRKEAEKVRDQKYMTICKLVEEYNDEYKDEDLRLQRTRYSTGDLPSFLDYLFN